MTSIQDWSKWNRMHGNPTIQSAPAKKDDGKAFRASIQMAERNGYFLNLDSDFLLTEFGPPKPVVAEADANRYKLTLMLQNLDSSNEDKDKRRRKDFLQIKYINLGNRHLRVLGPIEFCRNLRILILSNNYLTQIDSLANCKHLAKLDLHGNQLSQLPSMSMWANMRHLQVLFLHDNPIAKRSSVHGLTSCRSLVYLTLFDTPISLKKNYRHHMVNNIVCLKALDYYVISDEEIIEDVSFGAGRFSTFHPSLRIRPVEDDTKCKSQSDGERLLREQLRQIALALKHSSPVVIVQRFARGWLARRRVRLPSRVPTSLVQQGGLPPPPSRTSAMRQPPQQQQQQQQLLAQPAEEKTNIDFDDYVKRLDGEQEAQAATSSSPARQQSQGQQLRVSLDRLAGGGTTLEALDHQSEELDWAIGEASAAAEAEADASVGLPGTPVGRAPLGASTRYPSSPSPSAAPIVGAATVAAAAGRSAGGGGRPKFGPVMPTVDEDEELPMGSFRLELSGQSEPVQLRDAYAEMVLGRAQDVRFARDAELDYHAAQTALAASAQILSAPVPTHNDWRLMRRAQGTMGVGGLLRWARLERDLDCERRALDLAEQTLIVQAERERAKDNVAAWRAERRGAARAADAERVARCERDADRLRRAERREAGADARKRSVQALQRQRLRNDRAFAIGFAAQQNSIGAALKRHDFQAIRDSRQQANAQLAHSELEAQQEARESVQRYMQEQRDRRQAEMSVQRAIIDAHVLADMNDRLKDAYSRVAHLKTLRRTVIELSAASAPVPDHPDRLTAEDFRGADAWSSQVMVQDGRVGGHPSSRPC